MTTKVAFLFPGQGSQAVGMGADIFAASAAAKHVFTVFDDALGFPLSTLCFDGPENTLRSTINAQPAIVAVSLAYLAAFQEALSPQTSSWSTPLAPAYTAGHSVGEFSALVAAGAIDVAGVARLVRERGRLMHDEEVACPGGMAAIIGMDEQPLEAICQQVRQRAPEHAGAHPGMGQVVLANYNAPGQIVISGEQQALEAVGALAKERGAKRVMPLAVSGAFHAPVMQPAIAPLANALAAADMHNASIPIVANITAEPLTDADSLRNELAQQIAAPVQWLGSIEYLRNVGITTFFEIGPGQALAGMIRRIVRGATIINVGSTGDIEKAVALVHDKNLL